MRRLFGMKGRRDAVGGFQSLGLNDSSKIKIYLTIAINPDNLLKSELSFHKHGQDTEIIKIESGSGSDGGNDKSRHGKFHQLTEHCDQVVDELNSLLDANSELAISHLYIELPAQEIYRSNQPMAINMVRKSLATRLNQVLKHYGETRQYDDDLSISRIHRCALI